MHLRVHFFVYNSSKLVYKEYIKRRYAMKRDNRTQTFTVYTAEKIVETFARGYVDTFNQTFLLKHMKDDFFNLFYNLINYYLLNKHLQAFKISSLFCF